VFSLRVDRPDGQGVNVGDPTLGKPGRVVYFTDTPKECKYIPVMPEKQKIKKIPSILSPLILLHWFPLLIGLLFLSQSNDQTPYQAQFSY
jgi:hypothetical protein